MKCIQGLSVLTLQLYVNIVISKIRELKTEEESPLCSRTAWLESWPHHSPRSGTLVMSLFRASVSSPVKWE